MKLFFAAVVLLFASVAVAQSMVYLTQYHDRMDCTGSNTTFSLATGKCLPGDAKLNMSGIYLTCPSGKPSGMCAELDLYFRSENCSTKRHRTEHFLCGICQWGMEHGYYQYNCDPLQKQVTGLLHCDSTCKTCKMKKVVTINQCFQFGNDTHKHSAEVKNLGKCPPKITEKLWVGGTGCSGGEEHTLYLEENVCYDGNVFSCTKPPASRRLSDRLASRLLARSLRAA